MTVIQRRRPATVGFDADGDPASGSPTDTTIAGAFSAPRDAAVAAGSEILDTGRQGVIVGLTLYAPAGTDLLHTDQVLVDGIVYEIDGEVATWEHPKTGWRPGIVAALRRSAG